MDRLQIDANQLTHGELAQVVARYDEFHDAITAANNTLIAKLAGPNGNGLTVQQAKLLSDWAAFMNALTSAFFLEVGRLGKALH